MTRCKLRRSHWVGDGVLYWSTEKVALVQEPLRVLDDGAVQNGSTTYFQNAPLED